MSQPDACTPKSLPSSLRRHVPSGFTAEQLRERARRQAARAWRDEGILVVSVADDRLTWPERELIRQLGERLAAPAKEPR